MNVQAQLLDPRDSLPRCDCGHLFEICNHPNCSNGAGPDHETKLVQDAIHDLMRIYGFHQGRQIVAEILNDEASGKRQQT